MKMNNEFSFDRGGFSRRKNLRNEKLPHRCDLALVNAPTHVKLRNFNFLRSI